MRKQSVCLLAGFLLACWGQAHADVYACTVNGVKTFSEQPCGTDSKTVKIQGEKTVAFTVDMPAEDVASFCSIMMRGHEDAATNMAAAARGNMRPFYNPWTGITTYIPVNTPSSGTQEAAQAVQDAILAQISNLHQLARESPEMYHFVTDMASRMTGAMSSHSVLPASAYSMPGAQRPQGYQNNVDREAAQSDCQNTVTNFLRGQSARPENSARPGTTAGLARRGLY